MEQSRRTSWRRKRNFGGSRRLGASLDRSFSPVRGARAIVSQCSQVTPASWRLSPGQQPEAGLFCGSPPARSPGPRRWPRAPASAQTEQLAVCTLTGAGPGQPGPCSAPAEDVNRAKRKPGWEPGGATRAFVSRPHGLVQRARGPESRLPLAARNRPAAGSPGRQPASWGGRSSHDRGRPPPRLSPVPASVWPALGGSEGLCRVPVPKPRPGRAAFVPANPPPPPRARA